MHLGILTGGGDVPPSPAEVRETARARERDRAAKLRARHAAEAAKHEDELARLRGRVG